MQPCLTNWGQQSLINWKTTVINKLKKTVINKLQLIRVTQQWLANWRQPWLTNCKTTVKSAEQCKSMKMPSTPSYRRETSNLPMENTCVSLTCYFQDCAATRDQVRLLISVSVLLPVRQTFVHSLPLAVGAVYKYLSGSHTVLKVLRHRMETFHFVSNIWLCLIT